MGWVTGGKRPEATEASTQGALGEGQGRKWPDTRLMAVAYALTWPGWKVSAAWLLALQGCDLDKPISGDIWRLHIKMSPLT